MQDLATHKQSIRCYKNLNCVIKEVILYLAENLPDLLLTSARRTALNLKDPALATVVIKNRISIPL